MQQRALQLAVVLLAICAASAFAGDNPHLPTNEDLRHFRGVNAPRLSPDGRQVLVRIADSTADGGRGHLWLVETESDSSRQITFTPPGLEKDAKYRGEASGEWMPDGSSILFLSHRGEHTQLFRLSMHGGEAAPFDLKVVPPVDDSKQPGALPPAEKTKAEDSSKAVEPLPIDVAGYKIAPDGRVIAIWAKDPQTSGEKHQQEEKADAVWVDRGRHGTRLYLLDPADSKLTPVDVPPDVRRVSWSEQSDRLLAEVEAPNHAGDLGPAGSMWLLHANDPQHPTKLALPPTAHGAVWMSDGKGIFCLAQAEMDAPPGYDDLYRFTFADSRTQNLSRGFAGSIGGENLIAEPGGAVVAEVENGVQIGFSRFRTAEAKPEPINFPLPVVHELNTNASRSGWAYIASSSTQATGLYFAASLGQASKAVNIPSVAPGNVVSASSQLVRWNSDGRTIEGLLHLPAAASGGPVPLIVEVHGGPTGAYFDSYSPFVNFLVGQGWAVLRPNPRGSRGRGGEFVAANRNDLGGGDYRDIMAGVDAVLKQYPIDANRMALIGYSYGGEMAGFVEGKSTRFKAIVSGAPVIDQFSEYGTETESWYDRWFYGKPWEHFADAWRQSPLAGAAHASTPFLLLQGQEDSVDPPGQSREMYRALRQAGVPVELVEYPRDDHGPLARGIYGEPSSEPWHGFDARQRIVQFIEKAFASPAH